MRCRHSDSWLISGGSYEWCYRRGAIRRMRETGIAQCTPTSVWCKPTGPNGANPWESFKKRSDAYQAKREAR